MRVNVVLVALLMGNTTAAYVQGRSSFMRIRGGEADEPKEKRDEILARLNQFPTFCVCNSEDKVIGIPNGEGGHDVCWFIDAADAKEMLEITVAGNEEEEGLHLGCTPLGSAFAVCNGWVDTGEADASVRYKLQGKRSLMDQAPVLREMLQAKGIDAGCWTVPFFSSDDFQTDSVMYFFTSADDLRAGWVRSGRPADEAPEQPLMMDLRILVNAMMQDGGLRFKARLVPTPDAYALSQELLDQAKATDV